MTTKPSVWRMFLTVMGFYMIGAVGWALTMVTLGFEPSVADSLGYRLFMAIILALSMAVGATSRFRIRFDLMFELCVTATLVLAVLRVITFDLFQLELDLQRGMLALFAVMFIVSGIAVKYDEFWE